MENLEIMTDDELRRRLAQHGFGNMPVTDTTRKILLKKLKNAVEGETAKTRRETVAVTKFSSDEEIEVAPPRAAKTSNRRATVAAGEKVKKPATSTTNGNSSRIDTPNKTTSRRSSSRTTPAKDGLKDKPPGVSSTELNPILLEDSDEDMIELPVKRRSTSRQTTPTLGKSETVRTSYKNETITEYQDDSSNVEDDASFGEEVTVHRKPSPAPVETVTRRKTFTTSSQSYTLKEPEPVTPLKPFGRKTMTTSYNPRQNYKGDDDDDQLEINEANTPFLSDFAKRLSTLRAEPLDTGLGKYTTLKSTMRETAPTSSSHYEPYQSSYTYKPPVKQPATPRKAGIMKELGRVFDDLDRQYNLRMKLYITFIVMIIIAIYVICM